MTQLPLWRLYLLRAAYLLVAVGLALTMWPRIISHPSDWPLMNSVVGCMLGAVSVLAAIGIRYPLQMLPVLFFEIVWKSIWMIAVAWPLWSAGQIDARTMDTVRDCIATIVLIVAIPWDYVIANYVRRPGDRWKPAAPPAPGPGTTVQP